MRNSLWAIIVSLAVMAGCNNQPATTPEAGGSMPDMASSGVTDELPGDMGSANKEMPSEGQMADAEDATFKVDYGEWLELPETVTGRMTDIYPQAVQMANEGTAEDHLDLSMASYQIADQLIRDDHQEDGYKFYAQTGKALRKAMEGEIPTLPGSFVGPVFYNEACALAKQGDSDEALTALGDAVINGFTDFDLISSDEDLASLREVEGFSAKLDEWKQAAIEKIMKHAQEELENGESFPFEFAATDIDGTEQSLEALKGKVVIVDVWGTWCPPCRAEIPSFIKLQEEYGEQGFQMVGLNYERARDDEANLKLVEDYVAENGINYPCIMGTEEMRAQIPDFQGFPTTLFIDKTGKVRMKAVGLHDYEYLNAIVSTLLAES